MKKLLLALCFISSIGNSQNLAFQWAKNLGGTSGEVGHDIVVDGSGNVYSTGAFQGTADFDPGTGTANLISSSGSQDIFISKLDASGNFVWAKSIGGIGNDWGLSITTDALSNVYVTGFFNGTVDFDPGVGIANLSSNGGQDIFVVKFNSSGNFVNAFNMGGSANETPYSIALDIAGNIYTTGAFNGTVDFDPSVISSFTIASSGGADVFVSKLDPAGNFLWARNLGGVSTDEGHGIKVDASSNVYVTGFFGATADFDPGVGTNTLTSAGSSDIFICKLNSSGNLVWAKQMGGTTADKAFDLNMDGSGNVFTTGLFGNTVDFNPGAGIANFTSIGLDDVFICKLDASGNYVWAQSFGGSSYENGSSIAIDASSNVYVAGYFQGTVDFDPSAGVYNVTSAGSIDVFIHKLDASGNYLTSKVLGGALADRAYSIVVDGSGNIYTTGDFSSTVDFDPGIGASNITSAGGSDVFVHKMSSCTQPASPLNTTPSANLFICSNNSTMLTASGTGTVTWYASATSTTVLSTGLNYTTPVLAAGTYTYYAEALTCLTSATRTAFTLTVNPTPTITVNSGSVCIGSAFIVVPNGANTYTYMNSATGNSCSVSPAANTNFSLVGTSVAGCTSTATSSITVVSLPNIVASSSSPTVCAGSSITLFAGGATTYTWVSGPNTSTYNVSPIVFTTYTVNGTTNGCSSNDVISIGVFTSPTVNINPSSSTICSGSSATLSANGANTYTWNAAIVSPSVSVSPSTTTTYTVAGIIGSCTDTETISISVSASPTISISASSNTICAGQTATLSIVGAASSYTWNTGPTSTSIVVSPTTTTSYTAAAFNGSCYGIATTNILVNTCTGIYEVENDKRISIYPNPNNGFFNIVIPVKGTYNIINAIGQTISTFVIEEDNQQLEMNNLTQGVYYVIGKSAKSKIVVAK
jgi:hypothetical protein